MEIVNTTPYLASCTVSTDKHGQEHLLAIVKATFNIPAREIASELAQEPIPIIEEDIFSGDPETSATVYESDYALHKPKCDVLLNGYCYAPEGKPVTQALAGIKIGSVQKIIQVNGDRVWKYSPIKIGMSNPQPFTKKLISYEKAYGGRDYFHPDEKKHTAYLPNPVGIGYHKVLDIEYVEDTPVPNIESIKQPVTHPNEKYQPTAFGPVHRGSPSRAKYAGTYDEKWLESKFPFLPDNFDDRYFQAAPEDQQTDYLRGGEFIQLVNLTQEGRLHFKIPYLKQKKVVFYFFDGNYQIADFKTDTLHLLPEDGLFTLTARASIPLYGDPFNCSKVIIGRGTKAWERALNNGKRYIPSIDELKKYKRQQETHHVSTSG